MRSQWRWVILPPSQAGEPVRLANHAFGAVPNTTRLAATALLSISQKFERHHSL